MSFFKLKIKFKKKSWFLKISVKIISNSFCQTHFILKIKNKKLTTIPKEPQETRWMNCEKTHTKSNRIILSWFELGRHHDLTVSIDRWFFI